MVFTAKKVKINSGKLVIEFESEKGEKKNIGSSIQEMQSLDLMQHSQNDVKVVELHLLLSTGFYFCCIEKFSSVFIELNLM